MSFKIEGKGRFIDIMKFLEKLENSRWLISEVSFDILSSNETLAKEEPKFGGEYAEIYLSIEVYAKD